MTSPKGALSALIILLALPAAIAAQLVSDGSAELVIHLAIGTGCVLLAAAMFDFALPSWATWAGAAAAGGFGTIFLLQAASQLIPNDALHYVAYDVLGQSVEANLPYIVLAWFGALLLWGSGGKSWFLGLAAVAVVVGAEVATIAGPLVGLTFDRQLVLYLLPFAWLLVESVESDAGRAALGGASRRGDVADPQAA